MKTSFSLILIVVAALALNPAPANAEGWTDLFNGRDLSGWTQRGGNADYAVEEGCIVGTSVPDTPNSFLCTKEVYDNFILEFEFQVDPRLNSGVQIRSECFAEPTEVLWNGKAKRIPAGRVHGYQVEIDPDPKRDRWWTAGLYDEARRGWLYPGSLGGNGASFSDQGRKVFKSGEWNRIRVEAIGDSIRTWLNGEPRAEIRDALTPRGLIALQVHGIGGNADKAGAQVRWRNLRIREMQNVLSDAEKAEGWRLLWNGKNSRGWRGARLDHFPAQGWVIEDGVLTVMESGGAESQAGGDIVTVDRYDNMEFKVDFKITPGANSGIKYFCQPNLDPITGTGAKAQTGSAIGLEYQILDDERHPDAKQGRDGNRTMGSLYDLITAASTKRASPVGEWNTAHIISDNDHVEHWLNGQKVVEYERGSPAFRELVAKSKYKNIPGFGEWEDGHILLQDHGNTVSFRNVKLRLLPGKE